MHSIANPSQCSLVSEYPLSLAFMASVTGYCSQITFHYVLAMVPVSSWLWGVGIQYNTRFLHNVQLSEEGQTGWWVRTVLDLSLQNCEPKETWFDFLSIPHQVARQSTWGVSPLPGLSHLLVLISLATFLWQVHGTNTFSTAPYPAVCVTLPYNLGSSCDHRSHCQFSPLSPVSMWRRKAKWNYTHALFLARLWTCLFFSSQLRHMSLPQATW